MPTTTTRLGLLDPIGTDTPAVIRTSTTSNNATLDNAGIFLSGTLAGRPAASIAGRHYLATDVHDGGLQGTLFQDNGATWVYPNQVAYASGTIGSRPGAGTNGRHWLATDKSNQVSVDNGAIWVPQGLAYRAMASSSTAVAGEAVIASPSVTCTLPSPTTGGQMIAVVANSSVTATTPVTVAGTNIFGLGLNTAVSFPIAPAASFPLGTPIASVVLFSDGINGWIIISGQQDTGWIPLAITAANVIQATGHSLLAYRLRGNRVTLRGGFQGGGISVPSSTTLATVPLPPAGIVTFPLGAPGIPTGGAILANGVIENLQDLLGKSLIVDYLEYEIS